MAPKGVYLRRTREPASKSQNVFRKMSTIGKKKNMEQEVEQELSSLMEMTLRLEDELNYLTMCKN